MTHESLHAECSAEAGCAGGGQGVIWPGQIVPGSFRAVGTHKDGTCLLDPLCQAAGIGHQQLKVLRCKAIRELRGLIEIAAVNDQAPVADGGFGDLTSRVVDQLLLQLLRYLLKQALTGGQQDGSCHGVMLSLGQ